MEFNKLNSKADQTELPVIKQSLQSDTLPFFYTDLPGNCLLHDLLTWSVYFLFFTVAVCSSVISNGHFHQQCLFTVGSSCRFTCNAGYGAATKELVTCQHDLQWSLDPSRLCLGQFGLADHGRAMSLSHHFLKVSRHLFISI